MHSLELYQEDPLPEHAPTVYGVETEYSITVEAMDGNIQELVGSCHSKDTHLGLYTEPSRNPMTDIDSDDIEDALDSFGLVRNSNNMLSNGARIYEDPSGPEYCTPEHSTAEDTVLAVYDGDRLVYGVFHYLIQQEKIRSFQLNRRAVDHNRTSRGIHLNHSSYMQELPEGGSAALATAHGAKGALFGSGGLLLDNAGETHFHHSPRLSITAELDSSHWKDRPLIRHPFKTDNDGLMRIETLPTDAVNFPWSLRANLVFTNAVIRLIESGLAPKMPVFVSPIASAQMAGRYGHEAKMQLFDNGGKERYVRPQDVVIQLAELALSEGIARGFLDDESIQVLSEIVETADLLNSDNPNLAMTRVESLFRKYHIDKKMKDKKVDIDSDLICRVDYAWDKIGGGVAETLRNAEKTRDTFWHGFMKVPEPFRFKRRITKPPTSTRAFARGARIKASNGDDYSSWVSIDEGDNNRSYPSPLNQ